MYEEENPLLADQSEDNFQQTRNIQNMMIKPQPNKNLMDQSHQEEVVGLLSENSSTDNLISDLKEELATLQGQLAESTTDFPYNKLTSRNEMENIMGRVNLIRDHESMISSLNNEVDILRRRLADYGDKNGTPPPPPPSRANTGSKSYESIEDEGRTTTAIMNQETIINTLKTELRILTDKLAQVTNESKTDYENSNLQKEEIKQSANAVLTQEAVINGLTFELQVMEDRLSEAHRELIELRGDCARYMSIILKMENKEKNDDKLSKTSTVASPAAAVASTSPSKDDQSSVDQRKQSQESDTHENKKNSPSGSNAHSPSSPSNSLFNYNFLGISKSSDDLMHLSQPIEPEPELSQSTKAIITQAAVINGMTLEVKILEDRLEESKMDLLKVEEECERYKLHMSDLEESARFHSLELESLVKERDEAKNLLKTLKEDANVAELCRLKEELEALKREKQEQEEYYTRNHEQATYAILNQESIISGLQYEIKVLTDRCTDSEKQVVHLREDILNYQNQISDYQERAKIHSDEIDALIQLKDDAVAKAIEMESLANKSVSEKDAANVLVELFRRSIEEYRGKEVETATAIKALRDENDALRNQLTTLLTAKQSPSDSGAGVTGGKMEGVASSPGRKQANRHVVDSTWRDV